MFNQLSELSTEELKIGIRSETAAVHVCLLCGERFEEGEVYPMGGRFYTAEKAALIHVGAAHPPLLKALLSSESRYLNLTENQLRLLERMGEGLSDAEIAKQTGVSASTVRHQRFTFREKAKQAKLYLAIWELAEQNGKRENDMLNPHPGATATDDRYAVTGAERDKILVGAFSTFEPLRLKQFSPKQKKKLVILTRIAEQFESGKIYTEKEINGVLAEIYDDYVTLRRYLIEYGFLDRKADGSAYWVKTGIFGEAETC